MSPTPPLSSSIDPSRATRDKSHPSARVLPRGPSLQAGLQHSPESLLVTQEASRCHSSSDASATKHIHIWRREVSFQQRHCPGPAGCKQQEAAATVESQLALGDLWLYTMTIIFSATSLLRDIIFSHRSLSHYRRHIEYRQIRALVARGADSVPYLVG